MFLFFWPFQPQNVLILFLKILLDLPQVDLMNFRVEYVINKTKDFQKV